jgi:hypothetical protein
LAGLLVELQQRKWEVLFLLVVPVSTVTPPKVPASVRIVVLTVSKDSFPTVSPLAAMTEWQPEGQPWFR